MVEIVGSFNTARCFTDVLEPQAAAQIQTLCEQSAFRDSKIRVMPDVHAGRGCTIGTTMTLHGRVIPSMVGVDIGCGMETVRLGERAVDLDALDALIRARVPSGFQIRPQPHPLSRQTALESLRCAQEVNLPRALRSVGTLGGGNHFIELDRDEAGQVYLVVHSGSRHLGSEVAQYYQEQGWRAQWGGAKRQVAEVIADLKARGEHRRIQPTIQLLLREHPAPAPRDLAYVEGELYEDYLHDMALTQRFAALNRRAIVETILEGMGLEAEEWFTTIHNYIDLDSGILRKGAVSARKGERLLIPINMRDGALICEGEGNADWNFSAPHGAGRVMSRREALGTLSMEQYRAEMSGIYSTCVVPETLDESPMAYKSLDSLLTQLTPTARVLRRIRPVYNFKAS